MLLTLCRPAAFWLVVVALLTSGEARGQGLRTGRDFLPYCRAAVSSPPPLPGQGLEEAANCIGTVRGLLFLAERYEWPICRPPNATLQQAVRIVVGQLDRTPDWLHRDFESLATIALSVAWPCR
jgi:hypothetical protein